MKPAYWQLFIDWRKTDFWDPDRSILGIHFSCHKEFTELVIEILGEQLIYSPTALGAKAEYNYHEELYHYLGEGGRRAFIKKLQTPIWRVTPVASNFKSSWLSVTLKSTLLRFTFDEFGGRVQSNCFTEGKLKNFLKLQAPMLREMLGTSNPFVIKYAPPQYPQPLNSLKR